MKIYRVTEYTSHNDGERSIIISYIYFDNFVDAEVFIQKEKENNPYKSYRLDEVQKGIRYFLP